MLADWHLHSARWQLRVVAWLIAVLILACGGVVVVSSFRIWTAAPL